MKKPKLNLDSLTTLVKIAKARSIAGAMNLNVATFPNPNPTLLALTIKATEVEDAYEAAATGLNSAQTTLELRENELDILLTQEAAYVSNIAGGNVEKIEQAGMEAGDEKAPTQAPGNPQNLKIADNKSVSGSIKPIWKKEKAAKVYVVYIAIESGTATNPMPPTWPTPGMPGEIILPSALALPPTQPGTSGWILYDVCTATRLIISGLPTGKRVWTIVLAIGAGGKSGFSDPATIIVR